MKRQATAVRQCVQGLLMSSMGGQLQRGDTLGVWTFNDELHAGLYPLQRWVPESKNQISQFTVDFLKKQPCEKPANLGGMLAELSRVIQASDTITVIIFSDGEEPMKGTPFDREINAVYEQHWRELRDAKIPFVTVLQASGGKIVKYTLNSAAGPIDIPSVPPPVQAAKVAPKTNTLSAKTAASPPARTTAPLILDFSTNKPPKAIEAVPPKPAEPVTTPAETPKSPVPQATNPPSATLVPQSPGPTPPPAPTLPNDVIKTEITRPENRETANEPSTFNAQHSTLNLQPSTLNKLAAAPEPISPASVNPKRDFSPPRESPMEVRSAEFEMRNSNTPHSAFPTRHSQTPQSTISPRPPVQTAVAVPSETFFTARNLWITAAVVLAVVGGLFFLLRSRSASHSSLITQYIEHRKK